MPSYLFVNKRWFKTRWNEILGIAILRIDIFLMWLFRDGHNIFNSILSDKVFGGANTMNWHFISSRNRGLPIFRRIFKVRSCKKDLKTDKYYDNLYISYFFLHFYYTILTRLNQHLIRKSDIHSGILGSLSCFFRKSWGGLVCTLAGPIVLFGAFFALSSTFTDSRNFEVCLQFTNSRNVL